MAGPNFVLDKGFKVAAAATNVQAGRFCKFNAGTTGDTVTTSAAPTAGAAPLAAEFIVGVYQDEIVGMDAAKVATGKATINVRMLGISRMIAGAAVVIGARVTSDSTGRAVTAAPAAGASIQAPGVALTAAAAAGDLIDVFINPVGVATNGGT